MKREEINRRAELLCATLLSPQTGAHEVETVARVHLRSTVRATLEEAARADCVLCGRGIQLSERADLGGFWWHTDDYRRDTCDASGIHDLIATMESEGKDE